MPPAIVKLGGSLCESDSLPHWLQTLAVTGAGRVVLVPGGGPFADAVRQAQQRWHFNDSIAHHMALHAMDQYGLMLCGLQPLLQPARTLADISAIRSRQQLPVWLPSSMLANYSGLPESWSLTSDSLAAWLGGQLHATALFLIKYNPLSTPATLAELVEQGVIDRCFPSLYDQSGMAHWLILGRQQHQQFARLLQNPAVVTGC